MIEAKVKISGQVSLISFLLILEQPERFVIFTNTFYKDTNDLTKQLVFRPNIALF